jgi:hypothetical protein
MEASHREDELILAAQRMLDEHEAWENSDSQQIPESFLIAVDDCCTTWHAGDIPERCRSVLPTVERLTTHWREFETYASNREPIPRREFWEAMGAIRNALTWAPPVVQEFYCESVQELLDQKVTPRQIALIYSHEGKGPFMVDGQPQPVLVQREARTPGSVLPVDFKHPRTLAEQAARERYSNFVAYRAKSLKECGNRQHGTEIAPHLAPVGPEAVEDLIGQGLNDHQISVTKSMPLDEVRRMREELDAAKRGAARATIPFPSNVTDDEDAPEITDGQIADYLAGNPTATNAEAAQTLGIETRRVAVVRKKAQQQRAAA